MKPLGQRMIYRSIPDLSDDDTWSIPIPFNLIFLLIVPFLFVIIIVMALAILLGLGWKVMRWVMFSEPVAEVRDEVPYAPEEEHDDEEWSFQHLDREEW
jgi:hypothetical protein